MKTIIKALLIIVALSVIPSASRALGVNQCAASQGKSFTFGGGINGTAPSSLPSGTVNCVEVDLPVTVATLTVGVTGTWSGTLAPEESQDNGVTYTSAGTSITTNGTYTYVVAAFTNFRIRATAFSSGIANINLQSSTASSTGVSSLNALTGAITLTSTGSTVTITPSGSTIDLEATGSASGVSSFSGDGILITNSASTGAVTATLGTAAAHSYFGNNTNSTAAPRYFQPAFTDLSGVATVGQLPTGIPIANVGSAGLSGTSPIAISAAGAISCTTCVVIAGANTALSNLAAVAINAALLPGTTNSIALGSSSFLWSNAFLSSGTAAAPAIQLNGTANGLFLPFSNGIGLAINGTELGAMDSAYFQIAGTLVYGWSNSGFVTTNPDTGLSRGTAADIVDCGNGSFRDASCTFAAAVGSYSTSLAAGGFTPVSIGTPTQVYNTAATAQAASIGATTMLANPAADRNYVFTVYIGQVAQGTTCTIAGSVAVNIVYTDAITGNAYTFILSMDGSGGTGVLASVPLSTSAPTVANVGSGVFRLRAKASTNVQYSTTYSAGTCSSGSPSYSVFPVLEAL